LNQSRLTCQIHDLNYETMITSYKINHVFLFSINYMLNDEIEKNNQLKKNLKNDLN
jgi:hypothetical protein